MNIKHTQRLKAGILAMVLAVSGIALPSGVYAEEITDTAGETTEIIETDESAESAETDEPMEMDETADKGMEDVPESQNPSETSGAESVEDDEKALIPNSFRYENGEWIHKEIAFRSASNSAWSYVNGQWLNSLGRPIQGALAKGIDVSYSQGEIDWEMVSDTDVSYAVIRCGYGNNNAYQDDSRWKYNADECMRLGIPFGVYIYSYAMNVEDAKSEADHVLRLVQGYDLTLPIYLDLEDERFTGSLTNTEIAEIAEVFCTTVQNAGYDVGIYANLDWFRNRLTDRRFDQWEKWVAQYNYQCDYEGEYAMWQCTSQGTVDGIDGYVDVNFSFKEVPSRIQQVKAFVTRLYELVLNRKPDRLGLNDWKWRLLNQEESGAEVARGFVMSDEFRDRNVSDEEYIEILYNTCLGRSSDSDGKAYWMRRLTSGLSRLYAFRGFVESKEFGDICDEYGIIRGNIELSSVLDLHPEITLFVYRNYEAFLGRGADPEGLETWVRKLAEGQEDPKQVAYGFVFSEELRSKALSDEEFVRVLYRGIFDREADALGLKDWLNRLSQGQSRNNIFEGFANSDEFHQLITSFGL